jgi:two-component system NarL family response regulator
MPSIAPFRILIVEDFAEFRQFLRLQLQQRADCQVIGETGDGFKAAQLAEALQPDLILLDVGLHTLNGIDVARRIRPTCRNTRILFVTQDSAQETVQVAFQLGARGYLLKCDAGAGELALALDAVFRGAEFLSSSLRERLPQNLSGRFETKAQTAPSALVKSGT